VNRFLRLGLLAIILGLLGFTAFAIDAPESFRRELIIRWELEELRPGLWCRAELPPAQCEELIQVLAAAQIRAAAFRGQALDMPRVVYADSAALKAKLAVGNPFASSIFHLGKVLAVIGPRGADVDVVAHLLLHAEIKNLLGKKRFAELPSWFDEGIAAQVDRRPFLREEALATLPPPMEAFSPTARLGQQAFMGRNGEHQLAVAKRQLAAWLQNRPASAPWNLLQRMAAGEDFVALYTAAE